MQNLNTSGNNGAQNNSIEAGQSVITFCLITVKTMLIGYYSAAHFATDYTNLHKLITATLKRGSYFVKI